MNKRQAKRIALELVVCCIDMEIFNPTELPYQLLHEYGFSPENYAKLRDSLEDIAAGLKSKSDKLDHVLDHTRKHSDDWMFITKDKSNVD